MRIHHVALRVGDLEKMRTFFERWFGATSSDRYENKAKGFSSYFLSFESGAQLELVHNEAQETAGLGGSHLAFSLGSEEAVNGQSQRMEAAGLKRLDGPRRTGDGHWEALFEDPEGNQIELTA